MGETHQGSSIFAPVPTTTSASRYNSNIASPSSRPQTLAPPTLTTALRPPTLRTRSTGGLLVTRTSERDNEFDAVEDPSPVLSPTHQGLDGLSETLARLVKQRRYSNTDVDDGKIGKGGLSSHLDQGPAGQASIQAVHFEEGSPSPFDVTSGHLSPPTNSGRSDSPMGPPQGASMKPLKGSRLKPSPPIADLALRSPSKASSSVTQSSALASGSRVHPLAVPSAAGMLRKTTGDQSTSVASSRAGSPPQSGQSTPGTLSLGKSKPQVLETHHLQLQTHGPSGRRMINQYIIETELGRGVHGKVRLARDTETGEKVAVKIVEREGKKRLGGGAGWQSRVGHEEITSQSKKGKEAELKMEGGEQSNAPANIDWPSSGGPASEPLFDYAASAGQHASPPRSPALSATRTPVPSSPGSMAAVARYGRWGSGAPLRPTYGDKEAERQKEKEREKARKRQLWTTDKKVKREIALLKKCAHENVVRLKEVIDDPSSKKIFMVLEFMEGGEVQWKDARGFPTLTVDEARRTLRDVVLGLEYLHYQGIIHRDIKPANLLWDANRRVKISDFGVSHFSYALLVASGGLPSLDGDEERMKDPSLVEDHELAKTAGSPAFFAPELCLTGDPLYSLSPPISRTNKEDEIGAGFPWKQTDRASPLQSPRLTTGKGPDPLLRRSRPPITKAIDVWALGVTLYCLLFGHVPFMADSEFALFAVIPREDYELPAFMGADRVRIGPRRKRWSSLPQWTDEEADVHPDDEAEREEDADPASLSEEARLVRDLLDRLLEKDPAKRIKLDEVKMHPWVLQDIADPPSWLSETDPTHLPFVQVSNEEVEGALTGFSKIKQTLKRFQSKLFAGLGVQAQQAGDRPDHHHRLLHPSGGGGSVRRQRSKSASHANPLPPSLMFTSNAEKETVAERPSGVSAPATTASTPKPVHRPHHFFSRRQSTAVVTADRSTQGTALSFVRGEKEKSQSQPTSRPHSPEALEDRLERGKEAPKGASGLERSHSVANRRPSSFFKRPAGSRGEAREGPVALRKNSSIDGLSMAHARSIDPPRSASRPSSHAGSMVPNNSGGALQMTKNDSGIPMRTSQDSDAGVWSFVSASQSGNSTLQHSQSNRPRSRSRLSDVFRNVLGHHPGSERHQNRLRSRPGTASSLVAPSFDRSSDRGMTAASHPLALQSAAHEDKRDDGTAEEMQQKVSSVAMGTGPEETGPSSRMTPPNFVEVDDYDVDLDLSDDDLDEGKANGRRPQTLYRNTGNGWVMERNESSSTGTGHHSDSLTLDSLTPSVEGGYNLFKPPYTGAIAADDGGGVQEQGVESYAITQVHSDEAAALRRASAKVKDVQQRPTLLSHDAVEHGQAGDVSATTEDRFADAEEEEQGQGDSETEGEDGEEDAGVSFKAKKRAVS